MMKGNSKNISNWIKIIEPAFVFIGLQWFFKSVSVIAGLGNKANAVSSIILFPIILFYFFRYSDRKKMNIPDIGKLLVVTVILVVINQVIHRAVQYDVDSVSFLMFISSVFCGPVNEELIYRGILFERVMNQFGTLTAVFLSSVLFASAHGIGMLFPVSFLFGLVFGIIRTHWDTVAASTIVHIVLNLTTLIF